MIFFFVDFWNCSENEEFFLHFIIILCLCFRKFSAVQKIIREACRCLDTRRCDRTIRGWLCNSMSPTHQL